MAKCCCTNTLNIGCFCVASGFALDFAAPADGLVYRIVFGFHQTFVEIESAPTVTGEPVQFDTSGLNPFYGYAGRLYDANGEAVVLYDTEATPYDCIEIQPQTRGGVGKSIPLTLTA